MSEQEGPWAASYREMQSLLRQAAERRQREERKGKTRAHKPVVAGIRTAKRGRITLPFVSILSGRVDDEREG